MDLLLKTSKEIVLMQCNTNYTGSLENFKYVNLNVLNTFKAEYPGVIIGLSDHTPGPSTAMGAIALGAKVIEKHFTDDNNREGPDHPFSMNPKTWREMIDRCRELEASMGDGVKRVEENEKASILVQRRSLRAKKKLEPGHRISLDDLVALRPAPEDSFHPYEGHLLIGKKISATISEGQHFTKGILND
jgi:N-acetylneuraminate synthase